ncbi:MAG TPA: VTT domain-containing protein, partial [Verrucomicrobiota bacterium]|nr:VTT domain-containing protein [Verrucomicrobiota bacterium]
AGYWLARRGMRGPLTRWMERRGWRVPQLSDGDETLAILMLRVTPGIPLCVQNYLLGLAEVRFGRYLLLSLPAQAAYALAFVWLGNSLASSGVWRLALGVAALTGLVLLVSLLRRWLSRRASEAATVTTPLMKS